MLFLRFHCMFKTIDISCLQGRIQNFSEGAPTWKAGRQPIIRPNFPHNCMKRKSGPGMSKMLVYRSVTGMWTIIISLKPPYRNIRQISDWSFTMGICKIIFYMSWSVQKKVRYLAYINTFQDVSFFTVEYLNWNGSFFQYFFHLCHNPKSLNKGGIFFLA